MRHPQNNLLKVQDRLQRLPEDDSVKDQTIATLKAILSDKTKELSDVRKQYLESQVTM